MNILYYTQLSFFFRCNENEILSVKKNNELKTKKKLFCQHSFNLMIEQKKIFVGQTNKLY